MVFRYTVMGLTTSQVRSRTACSSSRLSFSHHFNFNTAIRTVHTHATVRITRHTTRHDTTQQSVQNRSVHSPDEHMSAAYRVVLFRSEGAAPNVGSGPNASGNGVSPGGN